MLSVLLLLIALSARLVPLQFSDLPYNIDGFPLARISEIIVDTGSLPDPGNYDGLLAYNMKLPVFSEVLAMFSLVLGVEPLALLPYFCAVIGSLSVVFIFALTRELTKNDLAAFAAGMFAALTGLFVYVTAAAMKQLLAITLLCFILYLYTKREDWRFRLAMAAAIALLPFTHHLTSLVALLVLSFALVGTAFRRAHPHVRTVRGVVLDAVFGPLILIASLYYYSSVNLEIASQVMNANDAVLLASVAIITAVLVRILSMTVQTKPWFFLGKGEGNEVTFWHIMDEKVLVLIGGIGALYLNSRVHLFTSTRMASEPLLRMMVPYFLLAIIALIGFNVMRYTKFTRRHLVVSMFMAPLCLMIFACLRDLDMFGFMVAYRSYSFIDIPMALAAGVGVTYLASILAKHAKIHPFYRPLPAFAVAIFILLCGMSLPLAYDTQEVFGGQAVTQEYETAAMEWAAHHGVGDIVTDQRYGDIINPYYGIHADRTGPWKMKAGMVESGSFLLVAEQWTETGAQMHPLDNILFTDEAMSQFLDECNVCYSGGPGGGRMTVAVYIAG